MARHSPSAKKAGGRLISDYIALNPSVPVNIGNVAGLTIRALPMHYLSIGDGRRCQ